MVGDPRLVPCVIFTNDYLNDHSKMPPAPRWHDYEAMAKWVKLRPVMLLLHVEMRPKTEREAISEARAGDCRALLAMGENGFQLSREAWAALRGNLEGKIKKPDQRPTQPPFGSALRSILPIAELAYEEIYALLRGHPKYSGRSHREIKDRALQLAAAEYGLEVETLAYYIERSSKSKSRHTPRWHDMPALESSLRA